MESELFGILNIQLIYVSTLEESRHCDALHTSHCNINVNLNLPVTKGEIM